MLSVQGTYDGVSVIPEEEIPFHDKYEVIITFLRPKKEKKISEQTGKGKTQKKFPLMNRPLSVKKFKRYSKEELHER